MFFNKKEEVDEIENKIIDNIKALNIDIINTKHNGNFDISLGLTKTLYTLYSKHLRYDSKNSNWLNRDRVVLSSSSAYSLLLSVLYMSGFDITLENLKKETKTKEKIPGIDIICDTFSEGIASATGIAMGEAYLEQYFKNVNLYNFYTYVICTDLDLIKGTSYEALSLASALKLNKLIILFDNNKNVLNDKEKDIFNIDIIKYFDSLNINTIIVDKNDLISIDNAITKAKSSDKPTVIVLNHDSSHDRFENNYIASDFILSDKETKNVKNELGVRNIPFTVTSETVLAMQEMVNERMEKEINDWNKLYDTIKEDTKCILERWKNNDISLEKSNINYNLEDNETIDNVCYKILNQLSKDNIFFIGGTSNFNKEINDKLVEFKDFSSNNYLGKNVNYGLRENAIGSIQNGISLTGIKNFSINSLRTVSKLISSMKIASEYNLANIYILIEDEDTLIDGINIRYNTEISSLRNIPNLEVYRPCDVNEMIGVFKILASKKNNPSCVIINRNIINIYDNSSITDVKKGAYIIKKEEKNISCIFVASGNDIKLALDISNSLTEKGFDIRVVSMPCMELYLNNKDEYKEDLIPFGTKVFVLEQSSAYGLYQFVYNDKYLITPDKVEWYQNEGEYKSFKDKILEKIENLLK